MDRRDITAIRTALDALPAQCRYHGDRTNPDRYARMTRSEACCDTGIPAHRRKQAEAALDRLDTTPPPAGAPGHESAARALLAGAIRICECGILTAGRGPCDHVSRCGSCGRWTPRATPDTSPAAQEH